MLFHSHNHHLGYYYLLPVLLLFRLESRVIKVRQLALGPSLVVIN